MPTDITLRNEIGSSIAVDEMERIGDVVAAMVGDPGAWRERIENVREGMVYHLGKGGEMAGSYILERVLARQSEEGEGADRVA